MNFLSLTVLSLISSYCFWVGSCLGQDAYGSMRYLHDERLFSLALSNDSRCYDFVLYIGFLPALASGSIGAY